MNETTMANEFTHALNLPARPQILISTLLNSWLAPRVVAKDIVAVASSATPILLANMLNAILLIGGNKTGVDRWYEIFVPIADKLYDDYLAQLKREGLL